MSTDPGLLERNLGAVFDVLDTDGDGFIEAADYVRGFATHGVPGEFPQAAFQGLGRRW